MLKLVRPETVEQSESMLQGARIALTGRFSTMTQREIREVVEQFGGEYVGFPARNTQFLVVGSAGPPIGNDGQPSQALQRARQLRADGYDIEIINEEQFLETKLSLFDGNEQVRQRYTIAQLSRILDVSRDTIRLWIRSGLIEPVETVHRLKFFDFKQVNSAKILCDLLKEGLPLAKIRESLQRVRDWMPGMDSPLTQLSVLEANGRMLVRLTDGRLAETSGQLQLDFDAAEEQLSLAIDEACRTADEWFQEALDRENRGDFSGAITAYENAISQEADDPILHFNLGNVLYAAQHLTEAETQFRRAVELDQNYVEAWNNLGTVLADAGRYQESVEVFQRALEVFPLYADAHFNLGDVYATLEQANSAQEHWKRYLQLDPNSPWAADVRARLAQLNAQD